LAGFLSAVVVGQRGRFQRYAEPFAGGAGAALRLLMDEFVEEIVINDLDKGVAAFWRSILEHTDEFLARLRTCRLGVREWRRQHEIYFAKSGTDLELGFATFYLNRTNRSGILSARPIGGLRQTGNWKIDARFNREDLARRIGRIARYRNRIIVEERDGLKFLSDRLRDRGCLFYVDPPYLKKGAELYLDTLTWNDHIRLSRLLGSSSASWVLTYDADPRVVADLYPKARVASFGIAHTAADQRVSVEYAVFADGLMLPDLSLLAWNATTITAGNRKTNSRRFGRRADAV
jgi:DNA adenine methylase